MSIIDTIDVRGGILVAHDGSTRSDSALRTALRCAPVFGNRVHVARAWSITTAATPTHEHLGYVPGLEEMQAETSAALETAVAAARAAHPDVLVTTSVVHARPAHAIVAASRHTELVVIGSRGLGGFKGLLLGSVSSQVLQHAHCGVLVDHGNAPHEQDDPHRTPSRECGTTRRLPGDLVP
ncbi:MAG: universal stress protein [Actinomycetales bacterium]|nr:MAG: universal stress protein [Actinomycetales bacterium]